MITRKRILIGLVTSGTLLLCAAGFFYDWGWINAAWYFRFYAIALLCWAIRMKMQSVSLEDALVLSVTFWLCIFNMADEFISATPAKPFKPWIFTIIIIVTSLLTYRKRCKSRQNP